MTTEALGGQDRLHVLVEVKVLHGGLGGLPIVAAGGCEQGHEETKSQQPGEAGGIQAKWRSGICGAWMIDRQFDPLPG
jgi:hypothetical protein